MLLLVWDFRPVLFIIIRINRRNHPSTIKARNLPNLLKIITIGKKSMKNSGFTWRKRLRSFKYAFHGIWLLVRYEHNAWIHCFAAVCVLLAGFLLNLSAEEWIVIAFAIGLVLAAEAINSSIEALADLVSPEYNEAIKRTKDLAAGAVLILAITAAIVGFIVFIPKLFIFFE